MSILCLVIGIYGSFIFFSVQTFSFPGGLPVSKGIALPETSVWLKSEYFKCNGVWLQQWHTHCIESSSLEW